MMLLRQKINLFIIAMFLMSTLLFYLSKKVVSSHPNLEYSEENFEQENINFENALQQHGILTQAESSEK